MKNYSCLMLLSTMLLAGCVTSPHVQYTSDVYLSEFELSKHEQVSVTIKSNDPEFDRQLVDSVTQYFINKGLMLTEKADLAFELNCNQGRVLERVNEATFKTTVIGETPVQTAGVGMSAMNDARSHTCLGAVYDEGELVWRIEVNLPEDYRSAIGADQVHFIAGLFRHHGQGILGLSDGQMY